MLQDTTQVSNEAGTIEGPSPALTIAKKPDPRHITTLLGTKSFPERSVSGEASSATQTWNLVFTSSGAKPMFKAKTKNVQISFERVSSSDRKTIDKCLEELKRIFHSWPFPIFDGVVSTALAVDLALTQVVGPNPPTIADALENPKGRGFTQRLYYIDSATGKEASYSFDIKPTDQKMASVAVPDFNEKSLIVTRATTRHRTAVERDNVGNLPSLSWTKKSKSAADKNATSSVASQRLAQKLCRYVALNCGTGEVVATDATMKALATYWLETCGYFRERVSRVDGKISEAAEATRKTTKASEAALKTNDPAESLPERYRLWTIRTRRDRGTTILRPNRILPRTLSSLEGKGYKTSQAGKFPSIVIHSRLSTRVVPVLDTTFAHWLSSGDARVAIIETARTADQVNLEIAESVPPSSKCDCSEDMTATTIHACHSCFTPTICRARWIHKFGLPVCQTCILREKLGSEPDDVSAETKTVAQAIVEEAIRSTFKAECKQRGIDPRSEQNQKLYKELLAELKESLPPGPDGTSYYDTYLDEVVQIPVEIPISSSNPTRVRRHPKRPTPDAVYMRAISSDGRYFAHVAGNVVITSQPPQFAKHISLPGYLGELPPYIILDSPTEGDVRKFIATVDNLHLARLKGKITAKQRLSGEPDAEKHERDMKEWVAGRVTEGEAPTLMLQRGYTMGYPIPPITKYIWNHETRRRLGRLAKQIAKKYNRTLIYSDVDDAPWFGHKSSMPSDWSWNAWAVFCKVRLDQMRTHCNKKWKTVDTEQSLFAEIMWQCLSQISGYGDYLRLPLVLWAWHPLRLSIGHKHHGSQMDSGWPPEPSDIDERDDKRNNMLIETWTCNSTKMDTDEALYEMAFDMLKRIKMPKKYYDPMTSLPTDIDTSLEHTQPVDVSEEYYGPMVDDDAGEDEEAALEPGDQVAEPVLPTPSLAPIAPPQDNQDTGIVDVQDAEAIGGTDIASEREALQTELLSMTKHVVDDCSAAMLNNPQIFNMLAALRGYASAGDRASYNNINIALNQQLLEYEE